MVSARGFTLLELCIALSLLMLISGLVAGSFGPWLVFQQKVDTDQRLAQLVPIWQDYLSRHAAEIEAAGSDAGLPVGGSRLPDGTLLQAASWAARLASALRYSGPELVEDGFHQPWRLHVSQGLVRQEAAVALHYHVLALLSAGANGHFEAGTRFDPDRGELVLAGDDRGVVIDGLPGAQQRLKLLEARLERAAEAWQTWFHSRWEADAERDASIDYFSAACPGDPLADAWDGAPDALPAGCNPDEDPAAAGLRLGLTSADLQDGDGQPLHFDSHSLATRNPDHPDPGQRLPPYSAIVSGTLPGAVLVERAVLGTL